MEARTGRHTAGRTGAVTFALLLCALGIGAPQAVAGGGPEANFDWSPKPPRSGDTVTFTAEPDPEINLYEWDLDNDGAYDDATGQTASRTFPSAGNYRVGLRVTGGDFEYETVRVRNRPPTAAIQFSPAQPRPGQSVIFTSASTDNEGGELDLTWDLDNDGAFDDDAGQTAVWSFGAVGNYTVRLRAEDEDDGVSVAEAVVPVTDAPPPAVEPRFLAPFPVVRIRGNTTRRGARIRLLRVKGPAGATVLVRCRGKRKHCPKRRRQTTTIRSRSARFHRFERRLRGGARLQVYVTQENFIGKYTRFKVRRRGRAPRRTDSCLAPGSRRPQPCSSFTAAQ